MKVCGTVVVGGVGDKVVVGGVKLSVGDCGGGMWRSGGGWWSESECGGGGVGMWRSGGTG